MMVKRGENMAIYPSNATDRRVDSADLKKAASIIFSACGMSEADADLLARTLVHADLRGVHSHGTLRVPDYVKKLTLDGVDPRGRPRVVRDKGAALVIDARNAMGQISGTFAMQAAIDKAHEIGVAFAAVRGSNHCGALDWYTLMPARVGMVGIAGTNALPTMAPWGGIDKIVGINPLSIAFPGESVPPLVLDFAFGATAHGKIRVYQQKGSPIPEGWAFDKHGRSTTVAAAALEGLIQPIGQHKGVGLAMVIGMLSTLLSGAAYGTQSGNMVDGAKPGVDGHFFAVINPDFFEGISAVKMRVDEIVRQVHESRPASEATRLLVPGELEFEFQEVYGQEGILLSMETIEGIRSAAASLRCDIPLSLTEPGT
jgi:LDH2 family malate/lactate/ureidoglycolate dehydrogenase